MRIESVRKGLEALGLSFALAATPAMAAQENYPLKGVKVQQRVSSNVAPNYRDVTVDCGPLIAAKQGTKDVLILTVAFIANFDATNSPQYMATLDEASRQIIASSRQNYTVNPQQVRFMIEHAKSAHGVAIEEIAAAFKQCDSKWARNPS